ncbi:MAG: FAD-dependent oxidoreductase [Gammaproteobacteria bacterium]|nr:FAD-dependent oxidoreductase [Gammaproteobacteria bacterium]
MANKNKVHKAIDIVIIGGGIAGLWTLARLRQTGYQAILLEADHLGCIQSCASQGIIHGGTKYALTGKLTHSAQSIQKMPQRWKACLEGKGEVNLQQAKKLSKHQYLWSNKSLASKITGFFASKVMTSRMQHLQKGSYVAPFNQTDFSGELYQLDEPVLDIQSVIETIREQFSDFIFQGDVKELISVSDEQKSYQYQITFSDQKEMLFAKNLILTAGAGNENLLRSLNFNQPKMQRRPLLMPMLKAKESILPKMYAHCLGVSSLPRMTITAHQLPDNQTVWYLGGEIAEKGVGRSIEHQIQAAKKELQNLMPWMDFSQCQWAALAVDRAEPEMSDGGRPVEPAVFSQNQVITAWPVKLAMAPIMVDKIIDELEVLGVVRNSLPLDVKEVKSLSQAQTSPLPWEKVQNWL